MWPKPGFPLFYWKKIQDFSRTPGEIFQDLYRAHKCLHIRKNGEKHTLTLFKVWSSAQKLFTACSKVLLNVDIRYALEAIEKYAVFKNIFPRLSRTLSFNFQDFPWPKWFSRTFQVLDFSRKKSMTFQDFPGGVGTLQNWLVDCVWKFLVALYMAQIFGTSFWSLCHPCYFCWILPFLQTCMSLCSMHCRSMCINILLYIHVYINVYIIRCVSCACWSPRVSSFNCCCFYYYCFHH